MLMPVLSTLLLLDVSVSATSNSSIIQHEDPIVFVRHLPNSLPSANSSSTAADVESESYDDSKQDNTDNDETDGKVRMFSFFGKKAPLPLSTPLLSKDVNIKPQSIPIANANIKPKSSAIADAIDLLSSKDWDPVQHKDLMNDLMENVR
ncbi:RxLR-like protein [Plasmopara halstedii]|uniref:RxLR-like protein n=1 Tax=Plasmopara halstedii TaxID=4781 RepID=A0A0N7L372_PLAHL|nr:RxLR-like protein [Plasmopara halstedii]CEG35067.1 RxLR-like protein [Plasmopara halstedii]|eukprot:XP_024571436.1 RxLR-like protein [Plasmopara halstedii]